MTKKTSYEIFLVEEGDGDYMAGEDKDMLVGLAKKEFGWKISRVTKLTVKMLPPAETVIEAKFEVPNKLKHGDIELEVEADEP